MIRKIALVAIAATLALGLFACKGTSLTTKVNLTAAEIQQKVDAKFPIQKSQNDIRITLSNPRVKLDGGKKRLVLDTDLLVKLPTKEVGRRGRTVTPPALTGAAKVDGVIEYDKAAGTVFFTGGKLVDFKLEQLPPELNAKVKAMAAQSVETQLAKLTIFTLDDAKIEQAAAKKLLQKITVTDGALEIEVGLMEE